MQKLGRSAIAEFLGTFALCFIGAGAICTNQWTNGAVGLLGIAMAHGMVLAVMVSALGHISGGHFNPAITVGILTANKISGKDAIVYILAQLSGAIVAGYLLTRLVPTDIWQAVHLGAPALMDGVSPVQGVVIEAVLTFFLALVVFGTGVDPQGSWNAIAGFGIGSVLIFDILFGGPLTGAAMNPARAFGPALAANFWKHQLVYWVGPMIGAVLAGFLYSTVLMSKKK